MASLPKPGSLPDPASLPPAAASAVIALVCDAFKVSEADLKRAGKSRGRLTRARFAACWLLRHRGKPGSGEQRGFEEIGRLMGGRDHSTMIHAVRRAAALAGDDPGFAAALGRLCQAAPAARVTLSGSEMASTVEAGRQARGLLIDQALAQSAANARARNRLADDDSDARKRAAGSIALADALRAAMAAAA